MKFKDGVYRLPSINNRDTVAGISSVTVKIRIAKKMENKEEEEKEEE